MIVTILTPETNFLDFSIFWIYSPRYTLSWNFLAIWPHAAELQGLKNRFSHTFTVKKIQFFFYSFLHSRKCSISAAFYPIDLKIAPSDVSSKDTSAKFGGTGEGNRKSIRGLFQKLWAFKHQKLRKSAFFHIFRHNSAAFYPIELKVAPADVSLKAHIRMFGEVARGENQNTKKTLIKRDIAYFTNGTFSYSLF